MGDVGKVKAEPATGRGQDKGKEASVTSVCVEGGVVAELTSSGA